MKRRQSLKLLSTLPLLVAFPATSLAKQSEKSDTKAKADKKSEKAAGTPANLIDEKDSLASAMQYKHDASKAPAMRTDKKAFCYNCAKYNVCMDGDKSCKPLSPTELKKAQYAPCQIFSAKVVAKEGWCLSWQAKA